MTQFEAKNIAEKYCENLGEVMPGYTVGVAEGTSFNRFFYFDFVLLTIERKKPDKPPMVGGAPGITVDKKTSKVDIVSFGELVLLRDVDRFLNDLICRLRQKDMYDQCLLDIKTKFKLNSKDFLDVRRRIENGKNDTDLVINVLMDLLEKQSSIRK